METASSLLYLPTITPAMPMRKQVVSADELLCWKIGIAGAPGTLYAGENFQLQFRCVRSK